MKRRKRGEELGEGEKEEWQEEHGEHKEEEEEVDCT